MSGRSFFDSNLLVCTDDQDAPAYAVGWHLLAAPQVGHLKLGGT